MSNIGRASIDVEADAGSFISTLRGKVQPVLSSISSSARSTADGMARSFGGAVQRVIPRIESIGQTFRNVGPKVSSLGDSLTKSITVPAVGAATAAAGITAALGWKRLTSIDTARGQLRGLGYESQDIERITSQLTTDLEGGMMDMGQATFAAAGAMAAGVGEGKELTKHIQTLDAAGVASTGTLEEMTQLFTRVADEGSVSADVYDMISRRVTGFSSAVQESTGKSGQALRDMLNNGELSYEEFVDIMNNHAGDMATEHAKTMEGMIQNTKAWIGVVGEALLGGVFEQSKESLAEFIEFLSSEETIAWAEEFGAKIGDAFTSFIEWIQTAIEWWMNLDGSTQRVILSIGAFAVALGPLLAIGGRLMTVIGRIIGSNLGQAFLRWAGGIGQVIGSTGLAGVQRLLGIVLGQIGRFAKVGGIFGIVIAAITAVWQSSEGFRDAVSQLWETVKTVFTNIASKVGEVFGKIGELFGSIGAGDGPLGQIVSILIDTLAPAFTMIVEVITAAVQIIGDVIVGLLDIFIGFMDIIIGLFTGDWQQVWDGVVQIFSGAWDIIVGIFTGVWDIIVSIFTGIVTTVVEFVRSTMEALSGLHESVTGWLDGVMQSFSDGVMNFFAMLGEWISAGWQGIVSFFQGLWVAFVATWTSFWNSLVSVVSSIWSTVSSAISTAWNFISNGIRNGLTLISAVWSTIWNAISSVASSVWSGIVSFVSSAINSVRSVISSVMSAIRSVISSVWNAISSTISSVLNGIRSTVTSIWNGIRSTITSVLNGIRSVVTSIWNGIRSTISSVLNGIRSVVTNVWNSIRSAISSAMSAISSGLSSAWNAARNLVTNAVNAIRNAVTNGFNRVVSFISSIPGRITSALGNLGNLLKGAGKSLIDGFLGGIKGAWGKVTGFVKDGLGKLRNLLPFSPAKEGPFSGSGYTLYSGQALIDDFAKGIKDQERGLVRSMAGVADSAAEALSMTPDIPDIVPGMGGLISGSDVPRLPRPPRGGGDGDAGGPSVMQVNGPLISVENMTVDSELRTKQVAQELYTRSMRQGRARGKVDLSGVVQK